MTATLGSVCQFLNGGTPSKAVASYFEGNIPWITSADIVGSIAGTARSFITEEAIQKSATNKVPAGSVLLVTRTGVGKVAITETELCFSQDITALIPDREQLDVGYLVQYLRTQQAHFERLARGATIKGITRNVVADLAIPLPPLSEQRRIAAILDQADALRAKRREALALLDSLTQSIFIEMFGDPNFNEKCWTVVTLDEICNGISDIDHKMPKAVEQGVPFVSAKDLVENGKITFDKVKRISVSDFRRLSRKSQPEKGDILYSRIGVNLGKARMVEVEFDFLASYSCCTIKPNRKIVDANFLCHLLDSPFILMQAHKGVRAIAVPDLGMGEIKGFKIILPPMEKQKEFSDSVSALEKLKNSHFASLAELDALFASLQHRAFRGEL